MKEEPKAIESGQGNPYLMLDSGESQVPVLSEELEARRKMIQNGGTSLDDKLEAYEDIMDSEVGDTSMVRARNFERRFGIRQLFLKFEGGNPTGTQKDRIAFSQCQDALRRGYDIVTVATCGNYGVAVSFAAAMAGRECIVYIPESYSTRRVGEMQKLGARIVRVSGDYEHAVYKSQEDAARNEWYDANPGGENTILQLQAYGEIAYEIYDDLRDAPKIVAVPVSNGTVIAGIYKGFLRLYRRGKTSRMPIMVAGSSWKKNPIVQAFLLNKESCEDLKPEEIRETEVNEPLINWHAFDGDWALEAIRNTNGWAAGISDRKMTEFSRIIREEEGMNVLPASTAGLAALLQHHQKTPIANDRFVAILTGRRS
jgi:threonine synthase